MENKGKRLFTIKDILALESGLYGGENEDGETVVVWRDKGNWCSIRTFQKNGWHIINYYDEVGRPEGETFESGRMIDTPALIRSARITLGLTQKQLGEACGYSSDTAQRYVERWEAGVRAVPRDKIKALAVLLNLDPMRLL